MLYFPFTKVYLVVNSYIVYNLLFIRHLNVWRLSLQKLNYIKWRSKVLGRRDRRSQSQSNTRGLDHSQTLEVSTSGEPPRRVLMSKRCEVLFLPHTLSRTLWPVHEAGTAALHELGEVSWYLVQLAIAASTEEGDPKVLPCMALCGN